MQTVFFFSPEVPVNDDPGDTEEKQHKPPPVRAPDAYNHHQGKSEQFFIKCKYFIFVYLFLYEMTISFTHRTLSKNKKAEITLRSFLRDAVFLFAPPR